MGTVGATISPFILTVLEQRRLLVRVQHSTPQAITTAMMVTTIQLELFAQQQP